MWKFFHDWAYIANDLIKVGMKSPYDENFDLVALSGEIKSAQVSEKDLRNAELAILRVQEFYHLDAIDVIRGKISNYTAIRALVEKQANDIVLKAVEQGDTCGAYNWSKAMIQLKMNVIEDGRLLTRNPPSQKKCAATICSTGAGESYCILKDDSTARYQKACNTKSYNYPKGRKKRAACSLNAIHPSQILQPIKTEQISVNPPIYQFHEVYTSQECDHIWATGAAIQKRSTVASDPREKITVSERRVGTNSWLGDDSSVVDMFSRRVGYATGMQMSPEDVEKWQAASYGIGGHYNLHHDYLPEYADQLAHLGQRYATFMVYLSDLPLGGATAFPHLDLSFFPSKGSALFWFDISLAGEPLTLTLHGGCPVLLGAKHIGNKWIRYNPQFLTYPCGRSPNSIAKLPKSLCRY
ncbi:prolyl 4-hydroxylase subunit alpha-2-like isoform X2 [Symsagittifera roscoffensis]